MAGPSWSLSIEELAAIGMQVIDTSVILVQYASRLEVESRSSAKSKSSDAVRPLLP